MLTQVNGKLKKSKKLNLENAQFHQAIKGHVQKALAQFDSFKVKSNKSASIKDKSIKDL